MNIENVRKLSIQVMIASLIGAAVIAVVAILLGEFNDILGKALFTLGIVALHSLCSLSYVESKKRNNIAELSIFNNTIFILIVLSFFTSIFGIWELFTAVIVGQLYGTYFVVGFAAIHAEILNNAKSKEALIDRLISINYFFMALVIILIMPLIWFSNNDFGDFYFRLLAASSVVDATLTILVVILQKLYLQKHPEEESNLFPTKILYDENGNAVEISQQAGQRRTHPVIRFILVLLFLWMVLPFIFSLMWRL